MSDTGFRVAKALFDQHRGTRGPVGEFELLDRTWELFGGVFDPSLAVGTSLFTQELPYPRGGRFLEVGCGAGVTAVHAAMSGCRWVTALDISWSAVDNTRRNAKRHGVDHVVRVAHSDLFSALAPDERFDLVFWNSNFGDPPDGFSNESELHHAFFDPGYATHRRFLHEAPRWLGDDGRLLLGFSSLGNAEQLEADCAEAGLAVKLLWSHTHTIDRAGDPNTEIELQLLELVRR
ncbi:methyltransferase [Saccharomonospora sp. CUA-673]|uniref:methyltransferase n=1 Tax=Saccharomonospora sp. CUA-673 TaxID=1904969 RepID=UPI00096734D4|nr:class I SAM-dependent methyltransferase [Saccharomonospora sp. CUA-673]OLT48753.1 methyltransferase [Saccharomonospora sp. CUA-673]